MWANRKPLHTAHGLCLMDRFLARSLKSAVMPSGAPPLKENHNNDPTAIQNPTHYPL